MIYIMEKLPNPFITDPPQVMLPSMVSFGIGVLILTGIAISSIFSLYYLVRLINVSEPERKNVIKNAILSISMIGLFVLLFYAINLLPLLFGGLA